MQQTILKALLFAFLSWTSSAFVVSPRANTKSVSLGALPKNIENPLNNIPTNVKAAAISVFIASQPLIALAEEAEDYEYGAVSAPPLVPIIGGLLAILTALLPIALRGGEEAFEEMKGDGTFGSGKDVLKSRKK